MTETGDKKDTSIEEDEKLVKKFSWMIRPCALYDTEHADCTSIKGRIDQYYVYGEFIDCNRWLPMIHDCRKWSRDNDVHAAARMISYEQRRVNERLKSHSDNDVMPERKVRPPPNWNDPLPEHILQKHEGSYLAQHVEEIYAPFDKPSRSCVIS